MEKSDEEQWAVSKKTDTKWNSSTFYGTVPQKVRCSEVRVIARL